MKFRTMFLALAFACIGAAALALEEGQVWQEIGRASCRERV